MGKTQVLVQNEATAGISCHYCGASKTSSIPFVFTIQLLEYPIPRPCPRCVSHTDQAPEGREGLCQAGPKSPKPARKGRYLEVRPRRGP